MRNPITMAKEAFGGWVDAQSPSSLGGIAFGLLTVGGLALIALGGHVDANTIVDELNNTNNEEGSAEDPSSKNENVIDITDQAIVE